MRVQTDGRAVRWGRDNHDGTGTGTPTTTTSTTTEAVQQAQGGSSDDVGDGGDDDGHELAVAELDHDYFNAAWV
jgi:hypothetical protein